MNRLYVVLTSWLVVFSSPLVLAQPGSLPASLAYAPDSVKLWTLRHIGDSLLNIGQILPARQAYDQSLALAKAGTDRASIGLGYRAVGYWYSQTGDFSEAISWYLKAMAMFRQSNSPRKLARTADFIAYCYDRLDKLPEARRYLLEGIDLARRGGYDQELYGLYGTMANLEGHSHHYEQALGYTQKILAYYKAQKDTVTYYGSLFNMALLYKNQGQFARAEQLLKEVLAYALKYKDTYMQGYIYTSLPAALIPQNKLDEAETSCQRALLWVDSTGTSKHAGFEEINGYLEQIAEKRGNYQQALVFYKRQMASHDSVFNAIKSQQLTSLETRYQTQQKESQIKLLDATNAQQARQIWAGIGGLLLLSVLLGALFWQYRRIGRSRAQIHQQAEQLKLMMKELHHRVKNNLAIVSSLLKLQSNRLDDEKAIQAVRVGQQRVEAMSLIHQRIYQTDQVTSVNMCDYLTDLTDGLIRAYGYQPGAFNLQLAVELPELDVDVAIPLGLIINELITNAFKYAYTDNQDPSLRIALRQNKGTQGAGMTLEVQDNGPGIDIVDGQPAGAKSFGKRLITSLTEQLEGRSEWQRQNGTLFRLSIPYVRLATV